MADTTAISPPAPAATAPNPGAAALSPPPPWYGEVKDDPEFTTWIESKGWKDPASALKSHRELEKHVGANRVRLPDEKDDITQWDGWDRLNVPKEAKGYEGKITRPQMPEGIEYDAAFEAEALETAAKLRIHPKHVQGLIDLVTSNRLKAIEAANASQKADVDAFNRELDSWGASKNEGLELAKRAAKEFGIEGDTLADLGGLVGSAKLIKAFKEIGKVLKEGRVIDGETRVMTADQAQAEIKAYRAANAAALSDVRNPQHAEAERHLAGLYKLAYPSNP